MTDQIDAAKQHSDPETVLIGMERVNGVVGESVPGGELGEFPVPEANQALSGRAEPEGSLPVLFDGPDPSPLDARFLRVRMERPVLPAIDAGALSLIHISEPTRLLSIS